MPSVKKTVPTARRLPKAKASPSEVKARRTVASSKAARDPVQREKLRTEHPGNGSAAQAALIDPDKPLTQLQRDFVKFWASGESLISAALKAGYSSPEVAYRLARQPNVLVLYQEEKRLYEQAAQMTRKRVMDGLLEGIEMAKMCEEPSTVIAGWREIGKMCGYYEPVTVRHVVSNESKAFEEQVNQLSDAELFEIIAKQAATKAEAMRAAQNGGQVTDAEVRMLPGAA